jgi:hypothetical protein
MVTEIAIEQIIQDFSVIISIVSAMAVISYLRRRGSILEKIEGKCLFFNM